MRYTHKTDGYSLVELLVYIGLFVAISLVIIQSLLFLMKTYTNARQYRTLQQSAETILERITREVRLSSTVESASSSFGTTLGTLATSGVDSGGNGFANTISVVSGRAQITTNGSSSYLSDTNVTVSELTFWNITTTVGSAVRVKLTLQTTGSPSVSATFYTTAILRQ